MQREGCVRTAGTSRVGFIAHLHYATTIADMWQTMVMEFNKKGQMIQIVLHCKMMERNEPLTPMASEPIWMRWQLMREHLSGMGVALHNDDCIYDSHVIT